MSQSEQQLRDIREVVETQAEALDRSHIDSWLDELGVRDLWETTIGTS